MLASIFLSGISKICKIKKIRESLKSFKNFKPAVKAASPFEHFKVLTEDEIKVLIG